MSLRASLSSLALLALACSAPIERKPAPTPAGPGVSFSWPRDGQRDVPVHAPVVVHFSDALSGTPAVDCATSFCVEGPSGPVAGQLTVAGTDTLVFTPTAALDEGTSYRVHARPALIGGATNLDADPLLTFVTRVSRPIPGVAAKVVAFNDAPLDGGMPPFIDAAPLRLVFSEPVDPVSISGATVTLTGPGGAVPARVSAGGVHVVVDPVDDLALGSSFTLSVHGARDLGGEAIADWSTSVTPVKTAPPEGTVRQSLSLAPAWTDGSTAVSKLTGWPANASRADSPLIGAATLGLVSGGLEVELGAADAFGGPIPMVVRRGQTLVLSPLAIRLGGSIESGYQTRAVHFTVLNDAVGWLTRSPFRPAAQLPDEKAPVFVDLTMDTVLTAEDPQGNAMSAQTFMGMRMLGTSVVDEDQLLVEDVASIELGTLGINVAPTTLALVMRTGAQLPAPVALTHTLTSTYPAKGVTDAPADVAVQIVFSESVNPGTVTLTENGTAVPATARVNGSVLIITPSRRLVDGARIVASWSGLTTLRGEPVTLPLADTSLAFSVAPYTATTLPPKLASVTVGAPCAVVRSSTTSGGACAGGQTDDDAYAAFALAANHDLRVGFTQPMRTSSLALGAACNAGAVRVERLDAAGTCTEAVKGTLDVADRGFRFIPASPWAVGTRYRLVIVGGANATCDAGEVCSRAGVPLNTDPLAGIDSPGGPSVVLGFTGAKASPDSVQPLISEPYTDLNDNGDIDANEVMHDENRVAMEITGTGGIVTSASLNGTDCVPSRAGTQVCTALRAELPTVVGKLETSCPIGPTGAPSSGNGPCLQIRVLPNVLLNTSLSMDATVIGIVPMNNLPTHELVMRVREPTGPALGYIMREAASATPVFVIRQSVYLDAPDLSIAAGLASHDLQSKPLEVVLKGPVTFLPDGRMKVALANLQDVSLSVNIRALGLGGSIDMRIPKGEMHVTVVGPPLR